MGASPRACHGRGCNRRCAAATISPSPQENNPMPFVPVPQTSLVEVISIWRQQRVENTIWVQDLTGPLTVERLQSLAIIVQSWFTTSYLTLISNEVNYLVTLVTGQEAVDSPRATASTPAASGGAPTPSQANNVSLAVSFQTGLRGR